MRLEALRALSGLRKAERRMAQQDLAVAIQAEGEAMAGLARANEAITREADAATALGADDRAVEAYARWLPVGRRAVSAASAALDRATDDVSIARTALTMARAEENAVASQIERCELEIKRVRSAREQTELDEIGSRSSKST